MLYANDQWNLSVLNKLATLLDNSTNHYLEAELLLLLHISKFNIENVTKIQEIIEHVIPIEATKQDVIFNDLGLNVSMIDEFKTILLHNQIIRTIKTIYFILTKNKLIQMI